MRPAALFLLLVALVACSGPRWNKPGAGAEAARADLAECQSQANAAIREDTDIDEDIMATRGNDWRRTGTLGAKRDTFATQNRGHAEDIVESCMRAKGYSSGPAPKPTNPKSS